MSVQVAPGQWACCVLIALDNQPKDQQTYIQHWHVCLCGTGPEHITESKLSFFTKLAGLLQRSGLFKLCY